MEKRNRYTAQFKAKLVLELLSEESTLNQVAAKYQLNPQMLSQWKNDFVKNAAVVFERSKDEATKLKKEIADKETRYQQIIGQMSYEIDWLKKNLASSSTPEVRKSMAEPGNRRINLARQAYLLTVNRTSLYRQPPTVAWSKFDLDDMRLQTEGIKISMDGKGRALDNIFVERFFRTLKYENIYLNEYETPKSLRRGLNQYMRFYNEQRLHESLGYHIQQQIDCSSTPEGVSLLHASWWVECRTVVPGVCVDTPLM